MLSLKSKIFYISLICIQIIQISYAQSDALFEAVKSDYMNIPNYECDVNISVNVSFITIPDRKGKMKYSKEKGTDFDLEGFAFLPKGSFTKQSQDILNQSHTVIPLGSIDSTKHLVFKVIPNDIKSDVVLGQFWINPLDTSISQMAFVMKKFGDYSLKLDYDKDLKKLPKRITVKFDVENKQLPAALTGDVEAETIPEGQVTKEEGSIVIDYSNYIIKD